MEPLTISYKPDKCLHTPPFAPLRQQEPEESCCCNCCISTPESPEPVVNKPKKREKNSKKRRQQVEIPLRPLESGETRRLGMVSGRLRRPKRKSVRNASLALLRSKSAAVLSGQYSLSKKTNPKKSSNSKLNKSVIAQAYSNETPDDFNAFSSVNCVLRMKLDEIIFPTTPVDGYDEALMKSVETASPQPSRKGSSKRRSTVTGLHSKMTNLDNVRRDSMSGSRGGIRGTVNMDSHLFLAVLPRFSDLILDELMKDVAANLDYLHFLESEMGDNSKRSITKERWVSVVYLDSQQIRAVDEFRRLVVRFILYLNRVAFEERCISSGSRVFQEFTKRVRSSTLSVQLPFVFTNGRPIGGTNMIYTIHTQNAISKIFKNTIMDPKMYHKWLNDKSKNIIPAQLKLKVPIAHYPLVQAMMKGNLATNDDETVVQRSKELDKFLTDGATAIKAAQMHWYESTNRNRYSEPDIFLFVQMDRTIKNILELMEWTLANSRFHENKSFSICSCLKCFFCCCCC